MEIEKMSSHTDSHQKITIPGKSLWDGDFAQHVTIIRPNQPDGVLCDTLVYFFQNLLYLLFGQAVLGSLRQR